MNSNNYTPEEFEKAKKWHYENRFKSTCAAPVVVSDSELLQQCLEGIKVLRSVLDKLNLTGGEEASKKLIAKLEKRLK
jgi:hypothetical protein